MNTNTPKNRFNLMDNDQLRIELQGMITHLPMTQDSVKLLSVVSKRLIQKELEPRAMRPFRHNTIVRGIDLTTKGGDSVESAANEAINMIKDAVYAADGTPEQCNNVHGNICRQLQWRLTLARLQNAQVYVELQKELELNRWRIMIDLPHPETKGMLVRHYVTGNEYYAFPITFVKLDPNVEPIPYNILPPSWTMSHTFIGVVVNFDTKKIIHAYQPPGVDAAIGAYLCGMDGGIIAHYEPGTLPREIRDAL